MSEELLPVETLESLSRQEGVDVRPILVRVLTDLFVQKPHHAPEEIARYQELTLQLLDVVSAETRAVVARKLADDPRAPAAIIARLLNDQFLVSAPIIAKFPHVPRQTLLALALDGGAVVASAVAQRADLDADMIRILSHHPDELVLERLAANAAVRLPGLTLGVLVARAARAPALATALLQRDDLDAAAMAPLYLVADPARRSAIREALAARPVRPGAARPLRNPDAVDAALVEAAAHSGRGRVIAEALGEALGMPPAEAARLSYEPSGEPFVMMLLAAGIDLNGVGRALLVAQPEIAQSVARFYDLIDIAEATPRSVAAELVNALSRVSETAAAPTPRHEPMFDASGTPERAGAARLAPRVRRPARTGEATRQRG
jgi:uncharacterized protein (DUF2336 family)